MTYFSTGRFRSAILLHFRLQLRQTIRPLLL